LSACCVVQLSHHPTLQRCGSGLLPGRGSMKHPGPPPLFKPVELLVASCNLVPAASRGAAAAGAGGPCCPVTAQQQLRVLFPSLSQSGRGAVQDSAGLHIQHRRRPCLYGLLLLALTHSPRLCMCVHVYLCAVPQAGALLEQQYDSSRCWRITKVPSCSTSHAEAAAMCSWPACRRKGPHNQQQRRQQLKPCWTAGGRGANSNTHPAGPCRVV
jgi:hypothetical protein